MVPDNATDHLALLSIMMVRVLASRLNDLGQLDEPTRKQLRKLVEGVRTHADRRGLQEMSILFDNLDKSVTA